MSDHEHGRVYQRLPLQVEVNLRSADTFFTGFSENISEGGLFIATDAPCAIGTRVDLSLSLMGQQGVDYRAVVRWVRPSNAAGGLPAGMGVQFVNVDEAGLEALQQFIDSRAKDTLFFELD